MLSKITKRDNYFYEDEKYLYCNFFIRNGQEIVDFNNMGHYFKENIRIRCTKILKKPYRQLLLECKVISEYKTGSMNVTDILNFLQFQKNKNITINSILSNGFVLNYNDLPKDKLEIYCITIWMYHTYTIVRRHDCCFILDRLSDATEKDHYTFTDDKKIPAIEYKKIYGENFYYVKTHGANGLNCVGISFTFAANVCNGYRNDMTIQQLHDFLDTCDTFNTVTCKNDFADIMLKFKPEVFGYAYMENSVRDVIYDI